MVNLFRADLQHLGLESDHPLSAAILRCGRKKKKKKPSCELALRASSPRAHMTTDLAFHTHEGPPAGHSNKPALRCAPVL